MDDDPNSYAHKKKFDDFMADLSLRIYAIMFWALEKISKLLKVFVVVRLSKMSSGWSIEVLLLTYHTLVRLTKYLS